MIVPNGSEKDLTDIKFIHFIFEKPDNKIIKFSEGQFSGNHIQIQFRFSDDQSGIFVSEKPPSQPNTALVGSQPLYQGKSTSFTIDRSDKTARIKIASTSTDDGSKWDVIYEGSDTNTTEISIVNTTTPTEGFIKDGGWGANKDANLWAVKSMESKPNLFKIVDDENINVATDLSSEQSARNYIAYYKDNKFSRNLPQAIKG